MVKYCTHDLSQHLEEGRRDADYLAVGQPDVTTPRVFELNEVMACGEYHRELHAATSRTWQSSRQLRGTGSRTYSIANLPKLTESSK
jgi:hypothetical protein